MTDILKRMTELAEMLGMDIAPSGKGMAELKGYAAGLEMVFNDMKMLEQQLYPFTATGKALSLICNQFKIDGNLSNEEKYRQIRAGYSCVYGDYISGAMAEEFKKYDVICVGSGGRITLDASTYKDSGVIENMGRIFRNYLSPSSEVLLNGSGLDFDYWDSTPYVFDNYDRLDIPFYILDKLK